MAQATPVKRWPLLLLALAGLILSLASELVHYRAYVAPTSDSFCAVGARLDCVSVALSGYSMLWSVPVPLWGVAGFMAIGVAAWFRSRWLLPLTAIAALASVALLVVELTAIGAVCLLCEGVHLVSLALLVAAFRVRRAELLPFSHRDSSLLIFGPAVGLMLAFWLGLKPYWAAFTWKGDVPFPHGKTGDGYPWIGAKEPKLTLHEFTDYGCPHCRAASIRSLRQLAKRPNEIRIVRRQFPRMECPTGGLKSCQLVRVAYCAEAQGKFWQADRWLFEHATGRHEIDVKKIAQEVGLDLRALEECVPRNDTFARAQAETRLAYKRRVPGTPYYMIEDKLVAPDKAAERIRSF